jgi:hypothetical protein
MPNPMTVSSMTRSVDPPTFESHDALRRSVEPPELWLVRLFGALVLHTVLLFGVRSAWVNVSVPMGGEGGTIEFVEVGTVESDAAIDPSPKAEGVAPLQNLKPGQIASDPDQTTIVAQPLKPLPSPSPSIVERSPLPVEPPKPNEPAKPTKPNEPAKPTKPNEPAKPTKPNEPAKPTKPNEPAKPTKPNEPAKPTKPNEPQAPATSPRRLPDPDKPASRPSDPKPDTTSEGNVGIQPAIDNFVLTPKSSGALQGSSLKGTATLAVIGEPPPGLAFKLPVKSGDVLVVQVRLVVNRNTQQVEDLDADGVAEVTVLSNSPAYANPQVVPAVLQAVTRDILKEYRFGVEYQNIDTAPPVLTEWEITLLISVL